MENSYTISFCNVPIIPYRFTPTIQIQILPPKNLEDIVTIMPAKDTKYNLKTQRPTKCMAVMDKKVDIAEGKAKEDSFTKIKPRNGDAVNAVSEATVQEDERSTRMSLLIVGCIFVSAILALLAVYLFFPKMNEDEIQYIKVPRNIEDAKNLGKVLSIYSEKYYYQVMGGYFITYIFLQSFAIPGSIFLSILSGFLFPFPLALSLVCLCSAIGASFCYFLSYLVGRPVIKKYLPERAADWSANVQKHRDNLFFYMVFLRITPFLPNWFINIVAPVIDVPLTPFFVGTFFGVAPPSFVAIQAGTTLHKLTSSGDALSYNSIILLAVFSLLSILPVIFKKTLKSKFE